MVQIAKNINKTAIVVGIASMTSYHVCNYSTNDIRCFQLSTASPDYIEDYPKKRINENNSRRKKTNFQHCPKAVLLLTTGNWCPLLVKNLALYCKCRKLTHPTT